MTNDQNNNSSDDRRGFASMPKAKVKELGAKGGRARADNQRREKQVQNDDQTDFQPTGPQVDSTDTEDM